MFLNAGYWVGSSQHLALFTVPDQLFHVAGEGAGPLPQTEVCTVIEKLFVSDISEAPGFHTQRGEEQVALQGARINNLLPWQ
jgi:hypothetical protein